MINGQGLPTNHPDVERGSSGRRLSPQVTIQVPEKYHADVCLPPTSMILRSTKTTRTRKTAHTSPNLSADHDQLRDAIYCQLAETHRENTERVRQQQEAAGCHL